MRTSYAGKFNIIHMRVLAELQKSNFLHGKTLYLQNTVYDTKMNKKLHHSPFSAAAFGPCGTSGLLFVLASEASDPLTDLEFDFATDHPSVLATAFASGMESDLDKQHLTWVLAASALAFQPSVQPARCRHWSYDYTFKTE
jgi:hypothetical protein